MTDVGSLEPVPIRDVWPDEARHLTPWLAERAALLSDALGMDLELEGMEVPVGSFSADLLYRDVATGSLVVVENMINPTDHDHVGKLITYGAGLGVNYAVLLAERFRPEHRSALTWLNSISEDGFGFFGLSLEVWRIGNSSPAPRLRVDVQPDDWSRTVRAAVSHGLSTSQQAYVSFWSELLPLFHEAHPGWSRASKAPKDHWINFPSTLPDVKLVASFCRPDGTYRLRVEAYVDSGDADTTEQLFESLLEDKATIEAAVGEQLEWDRLDNRRACRISLYFPDGLRVHEKNRWPEAQAWLIDSLGRMRNAFAPRLTELRNSSLPT